MLVKENSMRLQDVARSWLHEDKLHQGCLANPLTPYPSSIMRCHSFAQTHTCSLHLSSASLSMLRHTLPLHAQYYWGWTVTYPQLLWVWHFEVEIKVCVHGPYAISQRYGEIKSGENKLCIHVNTGWSWTADLICANWLPEQEDWSLPF